MATGAANSVFVDTNVLVFSTVAAAPLHLAARLVLDRLRASGGDLCISRQILREYAAVLSRPQSFTQPLPVADLIADIRRFSSEFRIVEDSAAVTEELLAILDRIPVGGRQIHDANIVATMRVHGIPILLTHNPDDFGRFAGLITVVSLAG